MVANEVAGSLCRCIGDVGEVSEAGLYERVKSVMLSQPVFGLEYG